MIKLSSLTLSNVAYCGQAQYLDHVYSGNVAAFVPTKVIFEVKHDVNSFVGYLPSDTNKQLVFRLQKNKRLYKIVVELNLLL